MAVSKTSAEIYSELHQDLIKDAQGGLKKVVNVGAVSASLSNILNTRIGERVYLRSFGSSISDLVFEPMQDVVLENIARKITQEILKWDNRVIVNSMDFKKRPDNNAVDITVLFSVKGFSQVFESTSTIWRNQ